MSNITGCHGAGNEGFPAGQRTIPSIQKAIRILDVLASARGRMNLSQLSRAANVPKSSALAICASLAEDQVIQRSPTGKYRLGPHVLRLSHAYLSQTDLVTEFTRICAQRNPLPAETLVLAVLDQTNSLYVARRSGTRPLGVTYKVGFRLPASCSASGKALLASLAETELAQLYEDMPKLPRMTEHSIVDLDMLQKELEETRSRGYAIDNEEVALGMICVGVPIADYSSAAAAAIAVSMVKASWSEKMSDELTGALRTLADAISASLGATTIAHP